MPRWIHGSTLLALLMACEPGDAPSPEPAMSAPTVASATAEPSSPTIGAEASSAEPEPIASAELEPTASVEARTGGSTSKGQLAPQPTTTAAASVASKHELIEGTKTSEPEYSVWLQGAGAAVAGKPSRVQAVLVAKGEWKCNENYPIKLKLGAPPAGVSYPSAIATGASVTKKRASLAVPFVANSPGDKTIRGVFHFSVCNASSCVMKKKPLQITVHVNDR